jgi:membrane-bound lytic murein transglycosylase A
MYLALLLAAAGCSSHTPKPDHFGAYSVPYTQLSGWQQDNHAQALATFSQSCVLLARKARPATSGSHVQVPASLWRSLCEDAARVPVGDPEAARMFFEKRFLPYRITNNNDDGGLFTGYYEPVLYGSRVKKGDFKYPLYLPPPELKSKKPYYSHAEIDRGALAGRKLELVWVDDPVMLFFLQIQGSGRVKFADGSEIRVGYADQNGYAYVSLGKIMGDEGLLPKDQINFFTIRQWLYQHPDRAMALMERNPSYVFFKIITTPGAVGAVGAVLTPQRSVAVDNRYIPYGLPLFMETRLPPIPGGGDAVFDRLVIAQDTGGAIRGPVRADIFFGDGPNAEYFAGYMKGHGFYSLLVPNGIRLQP